MPALCLNHFHWNHYCAYNANVRSPGAGLFGHPIAIGPSIAHHSERHLNGTATATATAHPHLHSQPIANGPRSPAWRAMCDSRAHTYAAPGPPQPRKWLCEPHRTILMGFNVRFHTQLPLFVRGGTLKDGGEWCNPFCMTFNCRAPTE